MSEIKSGTITSHWPQQGFEKAETFLATLAVGFSGLLCGVVVGQTIEVLTVEGVMARALALVSLAMSVIALGLLWRQGLMGWMVRQLGEYAARNWHQRTLFVFYSPTVSGEICEQWFYSHFLSQDAQPVAIDKSRPWLWAKFGFGSTIGGELPVKLFGAGEEWKLLTPKRAECLTFARSLDNSYEEFTLPHRVALARIARGVTEADLLNPPSAAD